MKDESETEKYFGWLNFKRKANWIIYGILFVIFIIGATLCAVF